MDDMKKQRILLVEDDLTDRTTIKTILQGLGHEIFEATDGQQAIDLFNSINPDIVLLDIVIPHIDGLDVLRKIRETDKRCGVIMISALSSEQLAIKSMQGGADDYVRKPVKLRNLTLNINRVIDRIKQREAEIEKVTLLETEVIELREELAKKQE